MSLFKRIKNRLFPVRQKTYDQVEFEVRLACRNALEAGWQIVPGCTLLPKYKQCCPVGAVGIAHADEDPVPLGKVIKDSGFPEEATFIANGFDSNPEMPAPHNDLSRKFYLLGIDLRKKYYLDHLGNTSSQQY